MADIRNPLEREVYLSKIAEELHIDPKAIVAQVNSIAKNRKRALAKKEKNDTNIYIGNIAAGNNDLDRKKHLKYAVAEEKIIEILIKNQDFFPYFLQKLSPDDFITQVNREIISVICRRFNQKLAIEPMTLSQELSGDAMNRLSAIIAADSIRRAEPSQLDEFIAIIKEFYNTKSANDIIQMSDDELESFFNDLKAKKN